MALDCITTWSPKSFQSLCCYNLVGSTIWWTHLPNNKSNKDAKKNFKNVFSFWKPIDSSVLILGKGNASFPLNIYIYIYIFFFLQIFFLLILKIFFKKNWKLMVAQLWSLIESCINKNWKLEDWNEKEWKLEGQFCIFAKKKFLFFSLMIDIVCVHIRKCNNNYFWTILRDNISSQKNSLNFSMLRLELSQIIITKQIGIARALLVLTI